MRRGAPHPAFLAAPPGRQWGHALPGLFRVLVQEARQAKGAWCWRILWRGAVVSLRLRGDFRLELRIARPEAPDGEAAEAAWERELATFRAQFGCEDWERLPDDPNAQGVAARFVQRDRAAPREENGDLFGGADRRAPSAIARGH